MASKTWNALQNQMGNLVVALIAVLVSYVLEHWKDFIGNDSIGSAVQTFWWGYCLPGIALYLVYQLYKFGRNFYQRFTTLELQVSLNAVDVDARLEKQAKSFQAGLDDAIRSLTEEIQKMSEQLDIQGTNRSRLLAKEFQAKLDELVISFDKKIQKVSEDLERQVSKEVERLAEAFQDEMKERVKLAMEVSNLKKAVFPDQKQKAAIASIVEAVLHQRSTPSLADMTPVQLLAGKPPVPKQQNSLAEMLGLDHKGKPLKP
jgi:ribosome-associated translation inhibitor RaiA